MRRLVVQLRQDGPEMVAENSKFWPLVRILVPAFLHQHPQLERHAHAALQGIKPHRGPGPNNVLGVADLGRGQKVALFPCKNLPHTDTKGINVRW